VTFFEDEPYYKNGEKNHNENHVEVHEQIGTQEAEEVNQPQEEGEKSEELEKLKNKYCHEDQTDKLNLQQN
jgi:hypothetical protein